jgi:CTP:phosphocholine cytidylyltransferase-like protein
MNIIILGDKFQKRMKSKGCMGLFKIKNEYIIFQQYKAIKKIFPFAKIIYVYGFESKKLLAATFKNKRMLGDIDFVYNKDYNKYNYGNSLQIVKDTIVGNTIICFGDVLLPNLSFLKKNKEETSKVFVGSGGSGLGCIINNSKIENIFYDLIHPIQDLYFICSKDTIILKKILDNKSPEIKNMFIFEIINKMIDKNVNFKPLILNKE